MWKDLTSDPFVLSCVEGVQLELEDFPYQNKILRPFRMCSIHASFIEGEILRLLEKGIITEVVDTAGHFVSNIFLRPKPNGTFRMIIDLSEMNNSVCKRHFKMQHLDVAIDMLSRGCYMASIDLKDAYYSVPIGLSRSDCYVFNGRIDSIALKPCHLG